MFAALTTWWQVEDQSAIFWENVEYVSMLLVALGVLGEIVADHIPKYRRGKGWTKKWSERAVVLALVIELVATRRANSISNVTVASLGNQAAQATQLAGQLGVKVDALPAFVAAKETEIASLNGNLQSMVDDEKRQSDATVKRLNDSLGKANATLAAVQNDEKSLSGSVNAIKQLQDTIRTITTPRVLTPPQLTALKEASEKFPPVKFDLAAVHDSDSPDLAQSIGVFLKAGNWDWQPRPGLDSVQADGSPQIGSAFIAGIKLVVCQSDLPTLGPPMQAIFNVLQATGWNVQQGYNPDSMATPRHQACGLFHVVVGSRW